MAASPAKFRFRSADDTYIFQLEQIAEADVAKEPKYQRVLLKISGEFMKGDSEFGLNTEVFQWVANEIKAVSDLNVQIGVVIGGGNIFRGAESLNIRRAAGDYIGMLATMINCLVLQAALEDIGVDTRAMSAIEMNQVAEPYIRRRAIHHLNKGRVVIFGSGTGNPFFTTDTAAALRANEIEAEILMKATQVDGVYSSDPHTDPNAVKLEHVSYQEMLTQNLGVLDTSAVSLCRDNKLPILIFNLKKQGNILNAVLGEKVGTICN